MARPKSKHPTETELAILNVLWERGECSVRAVRHYLHESGSSVPDNTVPKLLQIMLEKKLATRRDDPVLGYQVYKPAVPRTQVQTGMLADLIERAFGGSAGALVSRLLAGKKISDRDREQVGKLLKDLDENS